MGKIPITVAEGDGIGPEIMSATLRILEAAGAELDIHKVEIGEKVYLRGQKGGIDPSTWDKIRHTKAFLKAPITTPQGGGFKSLNVTVRTTLGLYANIRPCVDYSPFVESKHPGMDVVIIRENEEDLYTGIEYQQSPETIHALKIITRPGSERIVRYAFEYARAHGRKKVSCFTKDNILKMTDGLFHKIFDEIGEEYPDIEKEHWIVDIGAAKLADTPSAFDVVVLPNLYGDILSDVAAQIAGSVGLAGSANIGQFGAMFEAIHGSAPRRAGQNMANPSGLLLAAVMMLVHIGLPDQASLIHNAWLRTVEDGIHTYDIYTDSVSKAKVGTKEFADAVIDRLGQKPQQLKAVHYGVAKQIPHQLKKTAQKKVQKELVGVDVYIDSIETVGELKSAIADALPPDTQMTTIYNRGVKVWPEGLAETSCGDVWRCRFTAKNLHQIANLILKLADAEIDVLHTENLYLFDGVPGYPNAEV